MGTVRDYFSLPESHSHHLWRDLELTESLLKCFISQNQVENSAFWSVFLSLPRRGGSPGVLSWFASVWCRYEHISPPLAASLAGGCFLLGKREIKVVKHSC